MTANPSSSDITYFCQPGIFRIVCVKTKRAFFGAGLQAYHRLYEILDLLEHGLCPFEDFQQEFDLYGRDQFECEIIKIDQSLVARQKQIDEIKELQDQWPFGVYSKGVGLENIEEGFDELSEAEE